MSPNAGNVPALRIRDLRKSFAGVQAIDGLSFDVPSGSITGLIGPNGCGKSTSIDCISGFQASDAGEVSLNGVDISRLRPDAIARKGLTRTFQNIRLYDGLSIRDNLLIAAQEYDGCGWREAFLNARRVRACEERSSERARYLLSEVGLSRYEQMPAGVLSYGQKKLVALAACLMSEPRVAILDEPLAGVNPTMINNIERIIDDLNKAGQTFLIVEHNMSFVMKRCHRVVVMESGKKLVEGLPSVIQTDERVITAYLGDLPTREAASE
jgi:branched-chain amino acid transport system ATP-binding protein